VVIVIYWGRKKREKKSLRDLNTTHIYDMLYLCVCVRKTASFKGFYKLYIISYL
jgi:hypothetical protein